MENEIRNFTYQLANDQINNIKQEYEQPGWTLWALLIALANCMWLFIIELERSLSIINYKEILTLVFIGFFSFLCLLSVLKLLKVQPKYDSLDRFRYTNLLSDSRVTIIFHIIIFLSLFYATKYVHFANIIDILVKVYFIIILLVYFIALLLVSWKIPINVNSKSNFYQKTITFLVFTLFPLLLSISYYAKLNFESASFFSSIKISLLILIIAFILEKLTHYIFKNPILEELEKIRHDLSFNIISAEEGLERIEIAIDGLRLKHLFREDIACILNKMHSFTQHIEESRKNLTFLTSRYNDLKRQSKPPVEISTDPIINGLLKNIKSLIKELRGLTKEIQTQATKVNTKIALIFKQSINKSEIFDLSHNLDSIIEKGSLMINDFDKELTEFLDILDNKKTNPDEN